KGWSYALDHPGELAERIAALPGVAGRGLTRAMLDQEAREMRPFILPDVVEIGHMKPGRWERTARTFVEVGLAPSTARLAGATFDARADGDPAQRRRLLWLLARARARGGRAPASCAARGARWPRPPPPSSGTPRCAAACASAPGSSTTRRRSAGRRSRT